MSALIGKKAPDFTTTVVRGDGQIEEGYHFASKTEGKYALVFFYPLDFTFVCPSELIALDHRMAKFNALNVEVISVSVDSEFTHFAWRNTPIAKGGIGPVAYTMAADVNHAICKAYEVETAEGVALRGSFIIDRQGIVRAAHTNDLPLGRNIDELIRTIEALQFHEAHGEVCPAGWNKGDKGMKASIAGVAEYLADEARKL